MVESVVDQETRDLQMLLDTFGTTVSLSQIASAYCQGGRNIDNASNILFSVLQGSTSGTSTDTNNESLSEYSDLTDEFIEKASIEEKNNIVMDQKKGTASMGTVVGIIGKEYNKPKSLRNGPGEGYKPPKLGIEEYPEVYETIHVDAMHKDTEEFLFNMLGDGFKLGRKVIQDVLSACGYDVKTSMDKLLDITASKLEKNGDALNVPAEEPLMLPSDTCKESAGRLIPGPKLSESKKDRNEQERDILGTLFTVSPRIEEAPRRTGAAKAYKKPRAYGHTVTGPFEDAPADINTPVVTVHTSQEECGDDENEYENLRRAVRQYWRTMKEYYEAAVDAFTKGEQERSKMLMEKGHFYKVKACEADDKSSKIALESKDEGVVVDVHDFDPKDAIRLLKCQLPLFSSVKGFVWLKIIVGGDTEGSKDRALKRYVKKLLEKESIQWTEEGDGRTIVIKINEVDPDSFRFCK